MKDRQHTLLWMKDLIEHMNRCHEQLQWAADDSAQTYLTDSMLGDLSQCQRLCEELRGTPRKSRLLATTA